MALIMFSGMFGFGEMVSYISFMGDGGRSCWCGCLVTAESALMKNFPLPIGFFELCLLDYFIAHRNMKFHLSALFALLCLLVVDNIIKHSSTMGFWEDCLYFCRHVCSKTAISKHHMPDTDLAKAHVNFIAPFICESNGTPVIFFLYSSNVWGVIVLIMWLCCGAETPGGEFFVRSFVSHYPEGFSAPYFFCSESPGYTSVISLLLSPPSQLKDTNGID